MTRVRRRHYYGSVEGLDNANTWRLMRPISNRAAVTKQVTGTGRVWPINSLNKGLQVTEDENHGSAYWTLYRDRMRRRYSGDNYRSFFGDIGGPFWTVKTHVHAAVPGSQHLYNPVWRVSGSTEYQDHYLGPVLAVDPAGVLGMPNVIPSTLDELTILGTQAINRCAPTNPTASLFTSIAELYRDGLPSVVGRTLWKEQARAAKAAGGEYLNTEFGWMPLVSDIQNTVYAAHHAHEILSSYERNSGKVVRRSYEFPREVTETVTDLGENEGVTYSNINLYPDTSRPKPHLLRIDKATKERWFTGAFTYHLPYDYDSRNRMRAAMARASVLLGIELTPESVWNAAPWSWATNWFSDLGDVVENVSRWATDGQVMRYGYLMEKVISTRTYTLDRVTRYKPVGTIYASSLTLEYESRRRVAASPFGFGIKGIDLNPWQWSIITALGLSFR